MTNDQLQDAIRALSSIADEGRLPQLLMDFAAECRKAGGMPRADERSRTVEHMDAGTIAKSRELAKAVSHLFGLPIEHCERNAREALVCDPWSKIALDLIDFHVGRPTKPSPKFGECKSAKPAGRQAW